MKISGLADAGKTKPIKPNQTQPVVSLSNLFQSKTNPIKPNQTQFKANQSQNKPNFRLQNFLDDSPDKRFQFTLKSLTIMPLSSIIIKDWIMEPILDKQTDVELLARYAAGEEAAFREIVNRYKNGLYTFLKRFLNRQDLIEDVFQETFLQLFTSRDSFDTARPLRPWLFTIAANKAKDALRKRQRTAAIPIGTIAQSDEISFEDMLNAITCNVTMPYEELEKSETALRVRTIIANMPENLRVILVLAYFNKLSYKQMAQILSIPIGTVKSRLHTAVARFAKEWKASVGSKKAK